MWGGEREEVGQDRRFKDPECFELHRLRERRRESAGGFAGTGTRVVVPTYTWQSVNGQGMSQVIRAVTTAAP